MFNRSNSRGLGAVQSVYWELLLLWDSGGRWGLAAASCGKRGLVRDKGLNVNLSVRRPA